MLVELVKKSQQMLSSNTVHVLIQRILKSKVQLKPELFVGINGQTTRKNMEEYVYKLSLL